MEIKIYIEKMASVQAVLLDFLENEGSDEENYANLTKKIRESSIRKDKAALKSFLYLLANISQNHNKTANFYGKIFQILLEFRAEIKSFFSNFQIFCVFKRCKAVLLFLMQNQIMDVKKAFVRAILSEKYAGMKYPLFFFPEIRALLSEDQAMCYEGQLPDDFDEKRKVGENESVVCQLIRSDSIGEFISYVSRTNISINSRIAPSIFETNCFLLKKSPTLIEYSAFFGSVQVFRYLKLNGAKFDDSLRVYAVHGYCPEIIQTLNAKIQFSSIFQRLVRESIKCHHNSIADYLQNNLSGEEAPAHEKCSFSSKMLEAGIKYRNYAHIRSDAFNSSSVAGLFEHDHPDIIKILLDAGKLNANGLLPNRETPLHAAARLNFPEIIEILLSLPSAQIDEKSFSKTTIDRISIPNGVETIGMLAFCECQNLKRVFIPESVKKIEMNAFDKCAALTELDVPSSVAEIEASAFINCIALRRISLPSSLTRISDYAFYGCASLTQVVIPPCVESIEFSAFERCASLVHITVPPSVRSIKRFAFLSCTSLEAVELPDSVTEIGSSAFEKCSSLKQIRIPPLVTEVGEYTFNCCVSLESVTLSESLSAIRKSAFSGCTSLRQIAIPPSVSLIGNSAFRSCKSLGHVELPAAMTAVSNCLFKDCSQLKKVEIPPSVTIIGHCAFQCCTSLCEVEIPPAVAKIASSAFDGCKSLPPGSVPSRLFSDERECAVC